MQQKRTTAPDGVRDAIGPLQARPTKEAIPPQRRITPAQATRAALELAREHRHVHHRPTMPQLRALARFEGSRPCSYRLDPAVNWLPESLPADFPHGASGLCFAHRAGELVVLPDGGAADARWSSMATREAGPAHVSSSERARARPGADSRLSDALRESDEPASGRKPPARRPRS